MFQINSIANLLQIANKTTPNSEVTVKKQLQKHSSFKQSSTHEDEIKHLLDENSEHIEIGTFAANENV